MIPKKIHFCWFGRNEKSILIDNCIASWQKYLPEYEIIEWDEDSFDINSNRYVKEAYENKKWAFVSDYVRLWALKEYGGIYLDTDVEVFKSFDPFLVHSFFTGFEEYLEKLQPITAAMGAEKNNDLIAKLLSEYDDLVFVNKNGTYNMIPNTERIANTLIDEYNVNPENDTYQQLKDNVHIYPSTIFCNRSTDSYSMHHFDGSWLSPSKRLKNKLLKILRKFNISK